MGKGLSSPRALALALPVLAVACGAASTSSPAAAPSVQSAPAPAPPPSPSAPTMPRCVRMRATLETGTLVEKRAALDSAGRMVSYDITSTHPKLGRSRQNMTFRWNPGGTLREMVREDTDEADPGQKVRSSLAYTYGGHGELTTVTHGGDAASVTRLEWQGKFSALPPGEVPWAPEIEPFAPPSDDLPLQLARRSTESPMAPLRFSGTVRFTGLAMEGPVGEWKYDERGRLRTGNGAEWEYGDGDEPKRIRYGQLSTTYTWEGGRLVGVSGDGFTTIVEYGTDGQPVRRTRRGGPGKAETVITYDYACDTAPAAP